MPAWVRARGLALYALVMTGSIAIGSAVVGLMANWNLGLAHLLPALVIGLSPLAIFRWPLTWTQEYDLTLIPGDTPMWRWTRNDDGPVLVTVTHWCPERLVGWRPDAPRSSTPPNRGFRWGMYRTSPSPTGSWRRSSRAVGGAPPPAPPRQRTSTRC
jgi:hypothetical protein